MKNLTLITQVGGKINRPGQLAPPPLSLQLRLWDQTTKKTAQFDLNYELWL